MPIWNVIARHEAISNNHRSEIASAEKSRNDALNEAFYKKNHNTLTYIKSIEMVE